MKGREGDYRPPATGQGEGTEENETCTMRNAGVEGGAEYRDGLLARRGAVIRRVGRCGVLHRAGRKAALRLRSSFARLGAGSCAGRFFSRRPKRLGFERLAQPEAGLVFQLLQQRTGKRSN
jgi:hypothetical protein